MDSAAHADLTSILPAIFNSSNPSVAPLYTWGRHLILLLHITHWIQGEQPPPSQNSGALPWASPPPPNHLSLASWERAPRISPIQSCLLKPENCQNGTKRESAISLPSDPMAPHVLKLCVPWGTPHGTLGTTDLDLITVTRLKSWPCSSTLQKYLKPPATRLLPPKLKSSR